MNKHGLINELNTIKHRMWKRDIPHPTVPEYVELHEKIQASINDVDGLIYKLENEVISITEYDPNKENQSGYIFREFIDEMQQLDYITGKELSIIVGVLKAVVKYNNGFRTDFGIFDPDELIEICEKLNILIRDKHMKEEV